MLKKFLMVLLVLSFGTTVFAKGRDVKLPENRKTNQRGVETMTNKVNEYLESRGIEKVERGEVDVNNAGQYLTSIKGLKRDLEALEKKDPVTFETLKSSGKLNEAIRLANEVAKNAPKFVEAQKNGEINELWASLPQNVLNIAKSILDPSTRAEDIIFTLQAAVRLAQNASIKKADYEAFVAELASKGIDINDLLKCR